MPNDCPLTQHRPHWELRCRFLVAVVWVLGIGVMRQPATVAASGVVLLVMLLCTAVSVKRVLRNLLIVFPLLLISFVTLSISDGFPVTREAVDFAALIALRMTASVLAVGLVCGNDVHDYLNAFHAMRFPTVLTSTLFLTQRYVHVIGRQFSATRKALVSRLFSPKLRIKTFKIYGQIIGGMTIHAIDRSEHVRKAMESRGFQGQMPTMCPKPIHTSDVLKTLAAVLIFAAILFAERCWPI